MDIYTDGMCQCFSMVFHDALKKFCTRPSRSTSSRTPYETRVLVANIVPTLSHSCSSLAPPVPVQVVKIRCQSAYRQMIL